MIRPFLAALSLIFLLWPRALAAGTPPPALLVVISVDQMRAEYLDRYRDRWTGGFARLLKEGAIFTHARHAHVPVETGPGHAAILTGRDPSGHGIVANDWYDPTGRKQVYCVEDPLFRRSPRNLRAYTVGDWLKASDPDSKVAAVAGKDRAAILMGGQRADTAVWYDWRTGRFTTSGWYGPLPSWAEGFNREGLADRRWLEEHPADRGRGLTRAPTSYYAELGTTPFYDELIAAAAERLLDAEKLGKDAHPDLLAVGFSATDYIGHRWGPDSPQMREQLLSLDRVLGGFLAALDRKVGAGRWALALTADHGVQDLPESAEGKARGMKRILQADLLRRVEADLRARFPEDAHAEGAARAEPWVLGSFPPHFYLNRSLAALRGVPAEKLLAAAEDALRRVEAVADVFRPDDLVDGRRLDRPYADAFRRGVHPGRSGDLLVLYKPDWTYTWEGYETEAVHLNPYDEDARVPLILAGPRTRPGRYATAASVTDLAPTLGRWLGVDFPPQAGARVLDEALGP